MAHFTSFLVRGFENIPYYTRFLSKRNDLLVLHVNLKFLKTSLCPLFEILLMIGNLATEINQLDAINCIEQSQFLNLNVRKRH